jgi:aryl-alcohol dehydrogenase-like predicted oxidoreductase
MEYRYLGTTGVKVSPLAYGTMSFGGDTDEKTAKTLFGTLREKGINLFDCADVYQKGRSEEILGKLITSCRDEVVITSKAYFPVGNGPNDRGASRYHLVRAVENSLRRLATDRIDIYFVHRFDESTDILESLRTLNDLVTQGKILYPGLSNFAAWQAQMALSRARAERLAPPVVIQPMYNLAKRQAEVEILPMAQANGLGVISYSPLGGGLLSGKYGLKERPEDGRLVANDMYRTRYGGEDYYRLAEDFRELARRWGYHPVSLAVAWVMSHPAVTAPLIGAKTLEQLEPALAALDVSLTQPQRDEVSALVPPPPPATDRNEEGTEHNFGAR